MYNGSSTHTGICEVAVCQFFLIMSPIQVSEATALGKPKVVMARRAS